jgi:hypothetical protein
VNEVDLRRECIRVPRREIVDDHDAMTCAEKDTHHM